MVAGKKSNNIEYIPFFCGVEDLTDSNIANCNKYKLKYQYFKKVQGFDFKIISNIYSALKKERPSAIFLHSATFIIPVALYKLFNPKLKIFVRDTQAPHLKTRRDWIMLLAASLITNTLFFLTKESQQKFLQKSPLLKNSNTIVIANGVDTNVYNCNAKNSFTLPVIIGMQSRLQPIKDHFTLIKAFKMVVDKHPDQDIKLRIAGDGDTMTAIFNLIQKLKLEDNVELAGNLSEQQLVKFMKTLNIYVHATFGESLSNSILQAMSMSLPIIASNVWGVNNLIDDNVNGLLYTSENVTDLAEKIIFLLQSENEAGKIGKNARKKIEQYYSQTIMVANYEKVFLSKSS